MSKQPVRLAKEDNSKFNFMETIDEWALQNAHIILPLALIILLLLIGAMISSTNMTMTESNQYYYHLREIVKCINWRILPL